MGFFQSAIGHLSSLKDISHESKHTTETLLREACQKVREAPSPASLLDHTEGILRFRWQKKRKNMHRFSLGFTKLLLA